MLRDPFKPLPTPPLGFDEWLIIVLAVICAFAFFVKNCHGQELPVMEKEKAAQWVQLEYSNHWKGHKKMSFGRALGFVRDISLDCFVFGLNFDETLAQFSWESGFVNNIQDMKKKPSAWSFGIAGLGVATAHEEATRLKIPSDFPAHELIANEELNIFLGCARMSHLLNVYGGDLNRAEIAYNAGIHGEKEGHGKHYPIDIFETMLKWKAFKKVP